MPVCFRFISAFLRFTKVDEALGDAACLSVLETIVKSKKSIISKKSKTFITYGKHENACVFFACS